MIPVGVEHLRGIARDRADSDHVEIAELRVPVSPEVLVGNVAAADDGYLAVYSE